MLKDIVLNLKKESNLDQNGDCTINCTSLTYRKEEKNNQCNQIGLKQIEISNTSNFQGYCNSGNNSTRNTTDRSKRTNSHMIALAVVFVIMTKRIPCCYALWRRPGVRTERRAWYVIHLFNIEMYFNIDMLARAWPFLISWLISNMLLINCRGSLRC